MTTDANRIAATARKPPRLWAAATNGIGIAWTFIGLTDFFTIKQCEVVQGRVLPADRIGDGLLQALCAFPFSRRPHVSVAADLIDAPVNLQPVIVRIAEFDRELTSCAPPPDEIYRDPMAAQMVARPNDLVEGCDLERDMVELDIIRFGLQRADERNAVMVGVAAQEDHAAGHHLLRIDVRNLEAEHLGVEPCGPLDVAHIENDVSQLADTERKTLRPL